MQKINAIINARYKPDLSTHSSCLNIAFKGQKIIALGYLPDTEDITTIDANHHLILPNTYNLSSLLNKTLTTNNNNGIAIPLSEKNLPDFNCQHIPNIAYSLTELQTNPNPSTILAYSNLSELLFIIQESKNIPKYTQIHLILNQDIDLILPELQALTLSENISLGIEIQEDSILTPDLITEYIDKKIITSVSHKNPDLLLSTFQTLFKESIQEKIISLLQNPLKTHFNYTPQPLAIGATPSFTVISKQPTKKPLLTVINGNYYQ